MMTPSRIADPIRPTHDGFCRLGAFGRGRIERPLLYLYILLGTVIALVVYRAVQQDVTMDEAVTVSHWVLRDGYQWTPDTNNHMLNTLLMKISTSVLGVTPFSVRLPALLGAIGYSVSAFLLTLTLFGRTWRSGCVFVILTLNPFIMDYLCVARGYSIAMAAQIFTLYVIASDMMDRVKKPALDERGANRRRARQWIGYIGIWMLTLQFVSALHFNYVLEWKFTADISAAVKVAGDYAKTHNLHLVGTDSTAIAAADFYRKYYGLGFELKSIGPRDLATTLPVMRQDEFDLYLIAPEENPASRAYFERDSKNLQVLYWSPVSHLTVARRMESTPLR